MRLSQIKRDFICGHRGHYKLGISLFRQFFYCEYSTKNISQKQRSIPINVKQAKNRKFPENGPSLKQFLFAGKNSFVAQRHRTDTLDTVPYLNEIDYNGDGRKVFFEVYGCQMNVNDTEIVWSILRANGYEKAMTANEADVVLLMTCSIRDKAESKVSRLTKNSHLGTR